MASPLGIGIGVIYWGLLQKALSVYYDREKIDNMCKNITPKNDTSKNDSFFEKYDKDCEKTRSEKIKNIDRATFIPTMVISILTIIGSVAVYKYNDVLSHGLGLGSIMSIIYTVIANWYRFDDKQRLVTYFISFVVLSCVALKFFTNKYK